MRHHFIQSKMDKLNQLTIAEAVGGLKQKKFSCVELVQDSLAQIERYDRDIRAFITVNTPAALQKAKEADREISQNRHIFDQKPLLGIPYSAKDVFCTKEVKTTSSSQILPDFIPPYTATCLDRLDRAGAILMGKTNCDPFGFGSSTENSGFQITHNPWDLKKVPGGSSGGSAAAVACGMGLFSIGEDTGGSIRQPACFCSVSGLKVTYGRVSRYGVLAYGSSLDTIGPLAKNVQDIALILTLIAGIDPLDATTLPGKVPLYTTRLGQKLGPLTIGLPAEYFETGIDPEIAKAVKQAAGKLEDQGYRVKTISLPHTKYAIAAYYLAGLSEVSANLSRYDGIRYGEDREKFEPEVKRRIMLGTYALSSGYYEAYYKKAIQVRSLLKKDFDDAFRQVDVIIAPVSPIPPFTIGEKANDPLAMWLADACTVTINPAGVPSLAIPCGFTAENLPIGMQLIGPRMSEERLLQIGHLYQQLTDWHTRRPQMES